ncbi:MAG: PEP-CTERM sorting domain-containing protein, partial [Gemmatimonadaceae bacterium]
FTPGLSLSVTAFNASNVQIFNSLFSLQTSGPTLMNVNWAGVRSVTFASGTNLPGSQFSFDNFRFNNTVDPAIPPTTAPEPATFAMMGAGLAVVLLATRRRRS